MELAPALPACITAQLGTDFNLILTYDVKNSVILKMAKSGSVILIMFQCASDTGTLPVGTGRQPNALDRTTELKRTAYTGSVPVSLAHWLHYLPH